MLFKRTVRLNKGANFHTGERKKEKKKKYYGKSKQLFVTRPEGKRNCVL